MRKNPLDYDEKYCDMVIDHMSKGFSYESFAGSLGITVGHLKTWENNHAEFLEAKDIGQAKRLYNNEILLNESTRGELPGSNLGGVIFKLKNLGGGLAWTDKSTTDMAIRADVKSLLSVFPKFGE
jgi:hypothetical protein